MKGESSTASTTGAYAVSGELHLLFFSRVSNASVLQRTGQKILTSELERQQLLLYGRVARMHDETLMRRETFCPGSLRPATDRFVRKVGRPRLDWTTEVGKLAAQAAGSNNLEISVANEDQWKEIVGNFVSIYIVGNFLCVY